MVGSPCLGIAAFMPQGMPGASSSGQGRLARARAVGGCPQRRPALSPQMTYQGHRCLLWGALCAVGFPLATSQAEATRTHAPEGAMPGNAASPAWMQASVRPAGRCRSLVQVLCWPWVPAEREQCNEPTCVSSGLQCQSVTSSSPAVRTAAQSPRTASRAPVLTVRHTVGGFPLAPHLLVGR